MGRAFFNFGDLQVLDIFFIVCGFVQMWVLGRIILFEFRWYRYQVFWFYYVVGIGFSEVFLDFRRGKDSQFFSQIFVVVLGMTIREMRKFIRIKKLVGFFIEFIKKFGIGFFLSIFMSIACLRLQFILSVFVVFCWYNFFFVFDVRDFFVFIVFEGRIGILVVFVVVVFGVVLGVFFCVFLFEFVFIRLVRVCYVFF